MRSFNSLLLRCAFTLLLFGGFWWFLQGQGSFQQVGQNIADYLVNRDYYGDSLTRIIDKAVKPDNDLEVEVSGPLNYRFAELPADGKVFLEFGWQKGKNGWPRFSEGIEIIVDEGILVKAVLPGKVSQTGEDQTLGKFLVLDHGHDSWSLYGRLGNIGVREGAEVVAGQPLGTVEGKLLHFEFREGGKLVDPLQKLSSEL